MGSHSGNTDDAVTLARDLVLAERFEPAIALLREHLVEHSDDGLAWRRLAGALIGVDDCAAAVDAASRSIAVDPGDMAAYRYRALAYHLLKRHRESYADAQRAVELAPDDHESLSLLATNVLAVDRDAARFEELVQRALKVNPDSRPAQSLASDYRRTRRRNMAAITVRLAAVPVAIVLLVGWFTLDTGRSADAHWMIWPGLAAVAVVGGLRNWPLRDMIPELGLVHVAVAATAAGIIVAGVGFGAAQGVSVAASLGLVAVAVSGVFGLLLIALRRTVKRRARIYR